MTFSLRPEYDDPRLAELVPELRAYLDGELADFERAHDVGPETRLTRDLLEPVWRRSRELGFYGIHLPPEHGGQGLTYTQLAALKEEVGGSGRILAHSVLGDMGGPLRAGDIFGYATGDQLDRYLLPVARGERACCFAMSEAGAGSNVRGMTTTATRDGAGYRITGRKTYVSAGPIADFAVLIARVAGAEETYAAFLVDLDTPGCRRAESDFAAESDLVLEDCQIPAENLLGREGDGLRVGIGRVTTSRILNCPTVLGQIRRGIELSVRYAKTREVAGGPLANLQSIQHKLADMATEYYAARSLTYDALADLDAGRRPRTEAYMCKLFVAEAGFRIADHAVQIHGAAGLRQGSEIERLFRRLRTFRITTGSSEIQKNAIAKALLA